MHLAPLLAHRSVRFGDWARAVCTLGGIALHAKQKRGRRIAESYSAHKVILHTKSVCTHSCSAQKMSATATGVGAVSARSQQIDAPLPYGRVVVLKRTGRDSASFELTHRCYLFGRGAHCDVRIQLDTICEEHCSIFKNTEGEVCNASSSHHLSPANNIGPAH